MLIIGWGDWNDAASDGVEILLKLLSSMNSFILLIIIFFNFFLFVSKYVFIICFSL